MTALDSLLSLKQVLSPSLLSVTLKNARVSLQFEQVLDQLIDGYKNENLVENAPKRRELLKHIDFLVAQLAGSEENQDWCDVNIHRKALGYLLAGFIESIISPDEREYFPFSDVIIEKISSNVYAHDVNKIAFDMGHISFLDEIKHTQDGMLGMLVSRFKINFDLVGLNIFNIREPVIDPQWPFADFHEMLEMLEKTGGKVNKQDHKEKGTVPHRVHLIWDGGIPSGYEDNILSWKKHNPHFNVVLYMDYTDESKIDFQEFKKWSFENNILIVNIHDVIRYHEYYSIFRDANNAKEIYGARANNYGAASDVARYILLDFLGIYADVPDVYCVAPFPEKFTGNKLIHRVPRGINNDYLIVGDSIGRQQMRLVLQEVARATFKGWPEFSKTCFEENLSILVSSEERNVALTVWRTGVDHLEKIVERYKHYNNYARFDFNTSDAGTHIKSSELEDFVSSGLASSWVFQGVQNQEKERTAVPMDVDSFVLKIASAITGLLKDLNYYQEVINFDKYLIFSNPKAFEICLAFLNTFFAPQLSKVVNIIAYSCNTKVLVDNLHIFPNLSSPFIHTVCKTNSDSSFEESQKKHVINLIRENPHYADELDSCGDNFYMAACKNGNFDLALALMDEFKDMARLFKKNNHNEDIFDLCMEFTILVSAQMADARIPVLQKMFDAGFIINDDRLKDSFHELLEQGQLELALFIFTRLSHEEKVTQTCHPEKIRDYFYNYIELVKMVHDDLGLENDTQCAEFAMEQFSPLVQAMLNEAWDELAQEERNVYAEHFPHLAEGRPVVGELFNFY